MRASNIDLQRAAATIVDVADPATLALAVATGNCDAAGLSRDVFDTLEPLNDVRVIAETLPLPYGILMYPLEVGLGVRLSLNEHLPALAEHPADGRALRLLLGQDALVPVLREDFTELDAFMAQTGLDFAKLGD
jgi:ABC-type phosphate/phosphonate transport system substrate-binding protein